MNKAKFVRKALITELIPNDTFVIEKVINLTEREFKVFSNRLLDDYQFIKENIDLMYVDRDNVWHVIMVTTESIDYGILINSNGSNYAKYSGYVKKKDLK